MALSWARNEPYGDGLVAIARTFLQPCQELLAGSAPVRSPGEEQELLGVLAGEQSSRGVEVGDAGHLVDAFAPRRAGSGDDHLAHEPRLLLRDHLGDHAAHGEPEQVDPIEAEGTDEASTASLAISSMVVGVDPAGGTDTPVIEGDDPMLRSDAVHDSGVPVIQDCGQVGEEDHRHPRARAELTVGELHAPAESVCVGASFQTSLSCCARPVPHSCSRTTLPCQPLPDLSRPPWCAPCSLLPDGRNAIV